MKRSLGLVFWGLGAMGVLYGCAGSPPVPEPDPVIPTTYSRKELIRRAIQLFDVYAARWEQFSPAVADLYAEEAHIQTLLGSPEGDRVHVIATNEYQRILRDEMPKYKLKERTCTFGDAVIQPVDQEVYIRVSRTFGSKEPAELILKVGPTSGDAWKILEELVTGR